MNQTNRDSKTEPLTLKDLQLPHDDVAQFKRFFGINRDDEKRMESLADFAATVEGTLIDKFYKHLLSEPDTKKYFKDSQVLERARRGQTRLLKQMTSGVYNAEYIENRLQVGTTHSEIDLPPKWYIGSFAYYLQIMAEQLRTTPETQENSFDSLMSFTKLVFFDVALVMESFTIERERQLKKSTKKVMEAEEFMRSMLDAASNVAIYAITLKGDVQSWNKGAENLLGYTSEEVSELNFRRFYADVDLLDKRLKSVSTQGIIEHDGWLIRKDGTRFFGRISTAALRDDQQQITGYVEIVQDETVSMEARESLAQQRKEIAGLVSILSGVTAQVAQVATSLSSSTAESVAAITETTATSDEVRQTAEQTSVKAKSVSDDAKGVLLVSRQGQEATDNTIRGMVHIREQMESIADCMIQLTNQSKLIGDIIATVDDLAQQSNLLAVNASIEAAKAGEQGKGFAVVAQEVKNLSQQSKAATAHVRSILNDVVKATTAATAATEQGTKAVEQGHQQASGAGQVIKTLTESMDKAAQATELIEISSQQQLVGMKQVVDAMESIRELSQNNLQGAKQLDTAGKQLSELGRRLVEQTSNEILTQKSD